MSTVWLNGMLVDGAAARIDPTDRGFALGDGVFETLRVEGGVPEHAALHLARLRDGADLLGISVPFADDVLGDALRAVLRANNLVQAAMRLTLTRGPAARGALPVHVGQPTVLIGAGPLSPDPGPAAVIVCKQTRRNEFSPLARIKSLNYLDSVIARMEAGITGADDALLLNTKGNLAEASAANVFLCIGGRWVTPPVSDGALPGIARGLLLQAGVAVEARVSAASLASADAGCLVNALGWRKIATIDGRQLDTECTYPTA